MSASVEEVKPLGTAVYEILREARAGQKREYREKVRYSFFRPVTINVGTKSFSAFSREVSECGIGLLHSTELQPGLVEVTIPTEQGYSVRIRTNLLWCHAAGEGWYISGGEFREIVGIVAGSPVLPSSR
jgi:hypothetical protein